MNPKYECRLYSQKNFHFSVSQYNESMEWLEFFSPRIIIQVCVNEIGNCFINSFNIGVFYWVKERARRGDFTDQGCRATSVILRGQFRVVTRQCSLWIYRFTALKQHSFLNRNHSFHSPHVNITFCVTRETRYEEICIFELSLFYLTLQNLEFSIFTIFILEFIIFTHQTF